jgi:hypothetical protein
VQHDHTADDVLQLAHIAGQKKFSRRVSLRREITEGSPFFFRIATKMRRRGARHRSPFAQWRQVQRQHVKTIVKIFSETAGSTSRTGSRLVAQINRTSTLRAACHRPANSPGLHETQKLCLQSQIISDFVEEQRAAMGEFGGTRTFFVRAR